MQMQKAPQASSDAKYDVLKFVLSLMVVAIHGAIFPTAVFPWVRIAVPLFFTMTSYFFFQKLQGASAAEERTILKHFIVRNVKLYAFWFVVLLPLTLYIRRDSYFCGVQGILSFLKGLFFGSTFVASWYITASVIGVCAVFFLTKWVKDYLVCAIAVLAFGVVTFWSSYAFVLENHILVHVLAWYSEHFATPACSFPASLFWVYVGKCFAQEQVKSFNRVANAFFIAISATGLYLEWRIVGELSGAYTNDSYIMLVPTCISLFMFIKNMRSFECRYAINLRRTSTVIYVMHGTLLYVVGFLFRRILKIDSNTLNGVVTIACCMFVYAMMEFLLHQRKNNKLVSLLKNGF